MKKEVLIKKRKFNSIINVLIYIKQRNFCPSCKNEKNKIKNQQDKNIEKIRIINFSGMVVTRHEPRNHKEKD